VIKIHLTKSAVILSEVLQRNAKHEARLSKISVIAPTGASGK
jgi:hypothetical protein